MADASSSIGLLDEASKHPTTMDRPIFEIGVLGALSTHINGEAVAIRRGLPRVLLCSLVADRGRPVSADALIDRLWAEQLPHNPNNALQTQVAYLRRALGGAGVAPIDTVPSGYVLDRVSVDVDRFEHFLGHGRAARDPSSEAALLEALTAYNAGLALWRGMPYADVVGFDFAAAEIVRLEELHLSAMEERCEVLLALNRTAEAVAELSSMVNAQPLRERGHELLVVSLYRSGRQADALRAYDRARRTLVDELGIEPGSALRAIEQRVLDHDPGLDWVPPRHPATSGAASAVRDAPPRHTPERSARPGDIVAQRGELIGRNSELAKVIELVSDRRLVTLTGPGGAGKTRLALEVLASKAGGRVHLVDFAATDGHHGVGNLVASALGIQLALDGDPVASVIADIGTDPTVLLLDTCEHVLEAVQPLVVDLLENCPHLTVLATSRRPLSLPDELAWPIPPLSVPTIGHDPRRAAAFELFVRRAAEVNPDFEVRPDNVDDIVELCRSLDGLPLAIELAAAHMDVLSPSAVRTQLAQRRTLVARPSGNDRHRTLDATTAWSVDLLGEAERDMLYRLAVFAPTFDLGAVTAVAGCGADASVERFVTLVRSSLVVHDVEGRYRLLDTVRDHLIATETDRDRHAETRRRHAEHYAEVAARSFGEVRGPELAPWMHRLRADRPNLQLALRWCFGPDGDEQLGARMAGDIAWVWVLQGNLTDSQAALEQARGVEAEPLVRARLLLGIGILAAPLGDHARVIEVCSESAELGREIGDDQTVANALLTLGVGQWATGDLVGAAASHDEAIATFAAAGDLWAHSVCRALRARTARDVGDLDLAEALLDATIDDAKQTGDDHVIGLVYEQIARLALARDRYDRAVAAAAMCLRHNEAIGYAEGISAALTVAAEAELRCGDTSVARQLVVRALTVSSGIEHLGAMCAAVEVCAAIEASEGESASAARILIVARRARQRFGLPLPPTAEERINSEIDRLRDELGNAWHEIATIAPLTSLDELVQALIGTSGDDADDDHDAGEDHARSRH